MSGAASTTQSSWLQALRTWGEMIKFSHSLFALPFALLATFLAARPHTPSLEQVLLIVGCMVAARSAAMTFNRLADAHIDARNQRTASRALPAGLISRTAAWSFFLLACAAFILFCAAFYWRLGNLWPLLLSVPTLALLCAYSYTKRFTRFSHIVLGFVIALAPIAAWIAIRPETLGLPAWLLLLISGTWIAGFDIIYACLDVDFDRAAGLHSLPSRIGIPRALWVARALHLVTAAGLVALGIYAQLGFLYYMAVAIAVALLVIENSLVRPDDLSRVNLAFFTINGIISLLVGFLGVCDILLL